MTHLAHSTKNDNNSYFPIWRIYLLYIFGMVFTFTYWGIGVITAFITAVITQPFLSKEKHQRWGQRFIANGFHIFLSILEATKAIEIDDTAIRKYKTQNGPLIIASNHPALWDAVLLIRRFMFVSCIMKQELLNNPILRSGSRFAGFIPNSPSITMTKKASTHLRKQGKLLVFPEGTRTRPENGACNPFKQGISLFTKKSKSSVLPVFIFTNSPYLSKGWPIWKLPKLPIKIKIETGEIHRMKEDESVQDFTKRLENYFRDYITNTKQTSA